MRLEIDNLSKQFQDVRAVDQVSCILTTGVYGLLGVNGAGKTTLMRMLCTLLKPTDGTITWNGENIFEMDGAYRRILGYLPQVFIPTLQSGIILCISLRSRDFGLRPQDRE